MNRMTAFVPAILLAIGVGPGSLPIAGGETAESRSDAPAIHVAWEENERGEMQAPRTMMREDMTRAPRGREIQAPRSEDVQAPRAEDARAPRAAEIQPPRWRED